MITVTPYNDEMLSLKGIKESREVTLCGMVHALRGLGGVTFLVLRRYDCAIQCVLSDKFGEESATGNADINEGDAVKVHGVVRADERAPHGFEVLLDDAVIISRPAEPMPVPIHKSYMKIALDTELALRPLTLRNLRKRAALKLQEGIVRGFRDSLHDKGFTEIHSPKLVANSAEGGANVFTLDYFRQRGSLAQSPQFYKQMMVGVYERVFEVGPVFRAEKHNTARHLNEYTSLDFEMGFIESFLDVCAMETYVIGKIMELLRSEYADEINMLGVDIPSVTEIPALRFDEAKKLAAAEYGLSKGNTSDPFDMSPEEEQAIGRYAKEKLGSEFVFVTHYPSKKRPFYAMDDPDDARYTLSFDLLFRGMEVTTGGQRIHRYDEQVDKIRARGMDENALSSYLMIHRHGMPPHGGLGMGLERMLKQLIGAQNIRSACLFPRDTGRLTP